MHDQYTMKQSWDHCRTGGGENVARDKTPALEGQGLSIRSMAETPGAQAHTNIGRSHLFCRGRQKRGKARRERQNNGDAAPLQRTEWRREGATVCIWRYHRTQAGLTSAIGPHGGGREGERKGKNRPEAHGQSWSACGGKWGRKKEAYACCGRGGKLRVPFPVGSGVQCRGGRGGERSILVNQRSQKIRRGTGCIE